MSELEELEIPAEKIIIDVFALEKMRAKKKVALDKQLDRFSERLMDTLDPALSAKELIEKIIKAALEIEYGRGFTLSQGFAKMVDVIADTIVCNPELRRQALAVASIYLEKKLETEKQ